MGSSGDGAIFSGNQCLGEAGQVTALADFEAEHGPDPGAIEREVLAYELNASALLVERRGYDLRETAEGWRERLAGLSFEQRETVFELAREVYRPLAGCSAAEGRQVLDRLISAVQGA